MEMEKLDGGQSVKIVFLCDDLVNIGTIRDISTDDTTIIEVHSAAACPPIPVDCTLYEDAHYFDFSNLFKSDGSVYEALDLTQMSENGGNDDTDMPDRLVYVQACGELSPLARVEHFAIFENLVYAITSRILRILMEGIKKICS